MNSSLTGDTITSSGTVTLHSRAYKHNRSVLIGKLLFLVLACTLFLEKNQSKKRGILVLITDYLVKEHAKTDGKTSKQ